MGFRRLLCRVSTGVTTVFNVLLRQLWICTFHFLDNADHDNLSRVKQVVLYYYSAEVTLDTTTATSI